MGFCTKAEARDFLEAAPRFEEILTRADIKVFKYYLDIHRHEQKKRLKARRKDPLKQWKLSPVDAKAPHLWHEYSKARNEMFARTHNAYAPWTVVRADDKAPARLNVIRDILWRLDYPGRHKRLAAPDPRIVFNYDPHYLDNGMIAP